jgi:predicted transposase YdaD
MQLTIAPAEVAADQARQLIQRATVEISNSLTRREIIDIIAAIAVYKFADLSRDEVETMLGLNLEESRIYQEAKAEGKAEGKAEVLAKTIPLLSRWVKSE